MTYPKHYYSNYRTRSHRQRMQENESCTTVLAIQRHLCTCLFSWFSTSPWCQLKITAIRSRTLIADFALFVRIPSEYSRGPLRTLFIVDYRCATIRFTGSPYSVYLASYRQLQDAVNPSHSLLLHQTLSSQVLTAQQCTLPIRRLTASPTLIHSTSCTTCIYIPLPYVRAETSESIKYIIITLC